jgi:hypothetical protein
VPANTPVFVPAMSAFAVGQFILNESAKKGATNMSNYFTERVAKAIAKERFGRNVANFDWKKDVPLITRRSIMKETRVAIEAMRNPTNAMILAAPGKHGAIFILEVWEAMIDEAKK